MRKPFSEATWLERLLVITHIAIALPFMIAFAGLPFYGAYLIAVGQHAAGAVYTLVGVAFWAMFSILNRV